uniref:Uncharacterized protein n=1 Tax=Arundo donax TaxID=35708 RepID=A0A0A9B047_ARUDO
MRHAIRTAACCLQGKCSVMKFAITNYKVLKQANIEACGNQKEQIGYFLMSAKCATYIAHNSTDNMNRTS